MVSFFYDGLSYEDLKFIEMMCSCGFLQKSPNEAFEYLEEAAEKSHQWRGLNPTESTSCNPTSRNLQLKEENSINVKLV